jgi:hypothetical protein
LGHASNAVHHAYARRAIVVCPPLENFENKIIELNQPKEAIGIKTSDGVPSEYATNPQRRSRRKSKN